MDDRARLAAVLRELRELGVTELFLDGLTADQAASLVREGATGRRAAGPAATARHDVAAAGGRRDQSVAVEAFAGPPPESKPRGMGGAGGVGVADPSAGAAAGAGSSLEVLQGEASGCTRCRLSEGRTQVVFGRGSGQAELVVVGEAPGGEEDRTGQPFVGPAGKLLDLLLLSVGFDRDSVYICNVLKCRPPNNRNPLADEVETCAPYLHGQLDAIAPKVLLAVGKFSAQLLTGQEESIGRLRGRVHAYRGIPVVATYHPAYLLRSPQATRRTWHDLQLMRQVLDEHA